MDIEQYFSKFQIKTPASYRCRCELIRNRCSTGESIEKLDIEFYKFSRRTVVESPTGLKIKLSTGIIKSDDVGKFLVELLKRLWNDEQNTYVWCPHGYGALGIFTIKSKGTYIHINLYLEGIEIIGENKDMWKEKLETIIPDILLKLGNPL